MGRPLSCSLILVAALVALGCSEKETAPLTGPDLHTGLTLSSGCDLFHVGQLANSFLKPPAQQTAKNKVDEMAAAGAYSLTAKNGGFDIMALMEGALSDGTAGDPGVGSDLINHLLLCMYDPTNPVDLASYPLSFPDTFTIALTPTALAHGAFGGRSGTSTSPVYSRPSSAPFTGVAPPENSTWGSVISPPSTNHPARVVFYGRPATGTGATNQTYDWRQIPHNATYSPYMIVGICVDPFVVDPVVPENSTTTTMLNMQSPQTVGILGFVDAYFLTPGSLPGSCAPDLTLLEADSPFLLARRLVRFGTGLLTPRPLMATTLSPGGLGGRNSTGGGTNYKPTKVPSAQLTFVPNPPASIVQVNKNFPVQVRATSGGVGVNGDCIILTAINNNGQNTAIFGTHACGGGTNPSSLTKTVNNVAGVAQFCVKDPKTGTITLVATGNIEGRNDTQVTANSNKLNVKPTANIAACTP